MHYIAGKYGYDYIAKKTDGKNVDVEFLKWKGEVLSTIWEKASNLAMMCTYINEKQQKRPVLACPINRKFLTEFTKERVASRYFCMRITEEVMHDLKQRLKIS